MSGKMSTMTLTEFLLARIAEIETRAHEAIGCEMGPDEDDDPRGYAFAVVLLNIRQSQARKDLVECEVKRRLVEVHAVTGSVRLTSTDEKTYVCQTCDLDQEPPPGPMEWPCSTLLHLATVYTDHPDYRGEWAP